MAQNTTTESEKSQLDKFKQAARELECDDDEQRFKDKLGKVARVRAKPRDNPN